MSRWTLVHCSDTSVGTNTCDGVSWHRHFNSCTSRCSLENQWIAREYHHPPHQRMWLLPWVHQPPAWGSEPWANQFTAYWRQECCTERLAHIHQQHQNRCWSTHTRATALEPVKTLVLRYNTSVVNCVVKLRLVSVSNFTVMQVQILVITIAVNTSKM